jgi:hypothetical protein
VNIYHDKTGAHDVGGDLPPLPPMIPPGSTPLRMLARAVADALSLPPPRADHDEQLRYGVLDHRCKIVASACRHLAGDVEADSLDAAVAASSIRDRCADFPVNYSVNPLGM